MKITIHVDGFEQANSTGYRAETLNAALETAIKSKIKSDDIDVTAQYGQFVYTDGVSPKTSEKIIDYARNWWMSNDGEKFRRQNAQDDA